MKTRLLAVLFAAAVPNVHAVSITTSELPVEIQNCISEFTCGVAMNSTVAFQGMSAFDYVGFDIQTTDFIDGWLIRYSLVSPSQNTSTYLDYSTYQDWTTVTPYSGSLWMIAPKTYNPADAYHNFTMYIDKATPIPNSYTYPLAPSFSLGLTTTDLLAGGGFVYGSGEPDYTFQGSIQRNMWACIECVTGTNFNLVYLDYSTGSLNFNPSDPRGLLLRQYDSFETHSSFDQFYVQSVPIPSAFILFGSGLAGILAFRKSSRRNS